MANTPPLKIYTKDGEYIASFKHGEDAAILVAVLGEGTQIRNGHASVVWEEGKEEQTAGESYDFVTETIWERIEGRKLS